MDDGSCDWIISARLVDGSGRRAALLAVFARRARAPRDAHAAAWALSRVDEGRHHHASTVDAATAAAVLERVERGDWSRDPRIDRAVLEILRRGAVPRPDRLADAPRAPWDGHGAALGSHRVEVTEDGRLRLTLGGQGDDVACALLLDPAGGGADHARLRASGTLVVDGRRVDVEGVARSRLAAPVDPERAAEGPRLDLHLDGGASLLIEPTEAGLAATWQEGGSARAVAVTLEALDRWQSTRTFAEYVVALRVIAPEEGLDLVVRASLLDQELVSGALGPHLWAGHVEVEGRAGDRPTRGAGVMVSPPAERHRDLDSFFRAVGRVVRGSVARVLPLDLDRRTAGLLIGGEAPAVALEGVDLTQLSRTLVRPIREIVDRGGKSWRSYAAIACCDLVGGDSRRFVEWLAMPELMHVGSLIVDDVQDRSTIRRGGPAAHVVHGEPLAINAGTAAYFLTQRMLVDSEHLGDAERLAIYDLYFEALRAGHAGQALDLDGFDHLLDAAVEGGDAAELERRVLAVHRLKTALPASCLARMGAVAGGGSRPQIAAVGAFFEALGLAFQIVDDVLNVRGFEGDLKSRGEDIAQGKVTLPVAAAMARLDHAGRARLAAGLRAGSHDQGVVARVVDELEACGALDACRRRAEVLVEDAWSRLDPLVEDSLTKIMLRAFGWFVLERQY